MADAEEFGDAGFQGNVLWSGLLGRRERERERERKNQGGEMTRSTSRAIAFIHAVSLFSAGSAKVLAKVGRAILA
ncbi:hypothetical protein D3C78_1933260 [compost metagenome]